MRNRFPSHRTNETCPYCEDWIRYIETMRARGEYVENLLGGECANGHQIPDPGGAR